METKKIEENHNIKLLNEIYKNLKMGTQSIDIVLNSIKDSAIMKELSDESAQYLVFEKEALMLANSKDYNLKGNSCIQKTQVWISVKLNLLSSSTTQHIAEMMLVGTMMGIIDLVKAMTNYDEADEEIKNFAEKVLDYERDRIDALFEFLKIKNNVDDETTKNEIK